jgi:hypothetical protein
VNGTAKTISVGEALAWSGESDLRVQEIVDDQFANRDPVRRRRRWPASAAAAKSGLQTGDVMIHRIEMGAALDGLRTAHILPSSTPRIRIAFAWLCVDADADRTIAISDIDAAATHEWRRSSMSVISPDAWHSGTHRRRSESQCRDPLPPAIHAHHLALPTYQRQPRRGRSLESGAVERWVDL